MTITSFVDRGRERRRAGGVAVEVLPVGDAGAAARGGRPRRGARARRGRARGARRRGRPVAARHRRRAGGPDRAAAHRRRHRPRPPCAPPRWRSPTPCELHAVPRPVRRRDRAASHEVEIPVRYDGPDLDDVAGLTGLSRAEVVAAHTGTPWRVAFGGFAPGFAYLVGGDPRLRVPRRDRPRPRCPPGAVGLAGEFSGVYPRSSPGGWQLIGTTDAVLWDVDRDPPALLAPGHDGAVRRRGRARVSRPSRCWPPAPLVARRGPRPPRPRRRRGRAAPGRPTARRYRLGARLVGHPEDRAAARGAARWPRRPGPRPAHRGPHRCARRPRPSTAGRWPTRRSSSVPDGRRPHAWGCRPRACAPTSPSAAASTSPPVLGSRSTDTLSRAGAAAPSGPATCCRSGAPGDRLPHGRPRRPARPRAGRADAARGAARPARRLGRWLGDRARRPARRSTGWSRATATGSACACRRGRCSGGRVAGRRAAQRGAGARRGPGAAGRRAGGLPRRPPRDRRLPRGRGAHGIRLRPRGAAAARATPVRLVAGRPTARLTGADGGSGEGDRLRRTLARLDGTVEEAEVGGARVLAGEVDAALGRRPRAEDPGVLARALGGVGAAAPRVGVPEVAVGDAGVRGGRAREDRLDLGEVGLTPGSCWARRTPGPTTRRSPGCRPGTG